MKIASNINTVKKSKSGPNRIVDILNALDLNQSLVQGSGYLFEQQYEKAFFELIMVTKDYPLVGKIDYFDNVILPILRKYKLPQEEVDLFSTGFNERKKI